MTSWADSLRNIKRIEALGYLDFLNLLSHAQIVFTDSGGVQQEACIHHIPAVTLRENTEWTETLDLGANRLAGTEPDRIVSAVQEALSVSRTWAVPFGDGASAVKIVAVCRDIIKEK
jgi:UDP-N-acetylglucosamine 2-epimerase (non-hydrolysing)